MIDPKPRERIRDPLRLRVLHQRWRECALCGATGPRLSLHHIHRHPRDDVTGNLVMLCGDGVTGCHGRVEARFPETLAALREHVELRRDVLEYLEEKLGVEEASAWLDRHLPLR